jgi:hypothetical protein
MAGGKEDTVVLLVVELNSEVVIALTMRDVLLSLRGNK